MKIGVLQLIDSLNSGGAEKLAVSIANGLAKDTFRSYLCATRKEGILKKGIVKDVGYIFLNRTKVLDFKALFQLLRFIKKHQITIVHAHATSLYFGTLLKILRPQLKLIWHDHYGVSSELSNRPSLFYIKMCSLFVQQIISVNDSLYNWAKKNLLCKNVNYISNFSVISTEQITKLNKPESKKIICVAGYRPQKDHLTLLKAFNLVKSTYPNWTLHLIGKDYEDEYSSHIHNFIVENMLEEHVFEYGERSDIHHILHQADIGVLSSTSEGLPIVLLEYGLSQLPVVCSDVGQCKEVIDNDLLIFPAKDFTKMFEKLKLLIDDSNFYNLESLRFYNRVTTSYSEENFFTKLTHIYKTQ